jgi:hypothetical protein
MSDWMILAELEAANEQVDFLKRQTSFLVAENKRLLEFVRRVACMSAASVFLVSEAAALLAALGEKE